MELPAPASGCALVLELVEGPTLADRDSAAFSGIDPALKPVRDDPRYEAVLRRLQLPR